jgi:hypothetical protein
LGADAMFLWNDGEELEAAAAAALARINGHVQATVELVVHLV